MTEITGIYKVEDDTDAGLEMFWEGKPREIPSVLSGFTPAPDVLIKKYGYVTALVWGRIWRYCQLRDGVCRAKLSTIAGELEMSERTIIRHIEPMVTDGYLKDVTPELKNKPHIYADTGKIRIRISVEATMTESHPAMTESHREGDRESVEESIKKQKKKVERGEPALDFKSMTVPQARKLSTLRLYFQATDYFPGSVLWEYVHNTIQENSLTFEKIHSAAVEWAARGYKPENVKGVLEWAIHGIPAGKNGAKPAPAQAPDPMAGYSSLIEALERRGVQS